MEILEYLKQNNLELINGLGDILELKCSFGHIFKRKKSHVLRGTVFCSTCKESSKKSYIENLGYKIINYTTDIIEVKCPNRHVFSRSYGNFKRGTTQCLQCIQEENNKFVQSLGYHVIKSNGQEYVVQCKNNHIFTRTLNHFKQGTINCLQCSINNKEETIKSYGYSVKEINGDNIIITCSNGHTSMKGYSNFVKTQGFCSECEIEKKKLNVEILGYSILNVTNNIFKVQCSAGHIFSRTYSKFLRGDNLCSECRLDNKKEFLQNSGHTLLSFDGVRIEAKCSKGHIFDRTWSNFNNCTTKCPICFPNQSNQELEIQEILKENNINFVQNTYEVISKELDFYIPEKNLAIEFNGIYWHSELLGKDNKYHLEKTEQCLERGIHLLHVFENEWKYKKDIWKSIILGKLGKHKRIFARKTILKEVSKEEEKSFLEENHLQGFIDSNICLGLYFQDKLFCLMSFYWVSSEVTWQLTRFASKKNITVVGGASKLFKHFLKSYSGDKGVISYSDRRYSQGNLYKELGFKLSYFSEPNYFYFKNTNSLKFENFRKNLTEVEMQENNVNRIWDCGNSVWVYDICIQ